MKEQRIPQVERTGEPVATKRFVHDADPSGAGGCDKRQHTSCVRAPQDRQAAHRAWARTERNPAGPHLRRALHEDEVLVRRRRMGAAAGEHHARYRAWLRHCRLTEQAFSDPEYLLVVRHGVEGFESLNRVVDRAELGSAHELCVDGGDGVHGVGAIVEPAGVPEDARDITPKSENGIVAHQIANEQVAVLLRALTELLPCAQEGAAVDEWSHCAPLRPDLHGRHTRYGMSYRNSASRMACASPPGTVTCVNAYSGPLVWLTPRPVPQS